MSNETTSHPSTEPLKGSARTDESSTTKPKRSASSSKVPSPGKATAEPPAGAAEMREESTPSPTGGAAHAGSTAQAEGAAQAAVARVKDAVGHAAHETGALLHTASEKAAEKVRSGSHYVEHRAAELGEHAERAVEAGARRAMHAGRASAGFMSENAVPLLLIGAGLSLLALRAFRQPGPPLRRPEVRRNVMAEREYVPAPPAGTLAPTTTGTKLMGVRDVSDDYAI